VHFNRASLLDPDNYQPLFYMALVYRRMGDWGKSQSLISRVIRQNPQVPLFLTNIGLSYVYLHKFDSAMLYHQSAIDILPTWSAPYENMVETILLKDGNTKEARKLLDVAASNTGKRLSYLRIRLDIYDGELKNALEEADHSNHDEYRIKAERFLLYGEIYAILKNRKSSEIYYDSALVNLNSSSEYNMSPFARSMIAIAYAGKGHWEKAIGESKVSVDMAVKNRMDESDMKLIQAKVYTMAGDYENAIINLEYLLENPSCFSAEMIRLDPVWKPVLNKEELKTLIEKH
jgi:tetratricopeptide (TPR) repeat protein